MVKIKNPLKTLYLVRLVISLIYIIFLASNYNFLSILFHIIIVFVLFSTEIYLMLFLNSFKKIRNWKFKKYLLIIIPSIGFTFLMFLYITNKVMMTLWEEGIYLDYLIYILKDWQTFKSDTGISLGNIVVFFTTLFLFTYLVYFIFKDKISNTLNQYANKKKSILLVKLIVLLLLIILIIPNLNFLQKNEIEEPITSFFKKNYIYQELPYPEIYKLNYLNKLSFSEKNLKNIIIIFSDSTRAVNLPMYGYERNTTPFLNKLYEEGKLHKVEYAFSTCPESVCSAMSLLASKHRNNLNIEDGKKEIMLQEILKKAGYKNYIISAGRQKAEKWDGLEESYSEDFDIFFDTKTPLNKSLLEETDSYFKEINLSDNLSSWIGKAGERKYGESDGIAIIGLSQIPDYNKTPIFMTIFLLSAHHGLEKEERFMEYKPSKSIINIAGLIRGELNREEIINRYDNGLLQADHYVSLVFEILEKKGYLNNSILIFLGDHGEAIGEKGYYAHGFHLTGEEIRVPMLIYTSDEIKFENEDYAVFVDIAPTILDILDINSPKTWVGKSLLEKGTRESSIHELIYSYKERVLIVKKESKLYKYWYSSNIDNYFDDNAVQQIYELYSDPKEEKNIINEIPESLYSEIKQEFIEKFDLDDIKMPL